MPKDKENSFYSKKLSEEHKKKIGLAHKSYMKRLGLTFKGKENPFYGKHHTEETKKKMSLAKTGKRLSKEHIEKCAQGHRGLKYPPKSEEARLKIGIKSKGHKMPDVTRKALLKSRLGIPLSAEHREIMKKIMLGNKHGQKPKGYEYKTPIMKNIRNSIRNQQWRQNIFIRDNFTCQKCRIKSGCGHKVSFEAHHITSFKSLLEEAKKYMPLFSLYEAAMLYSPLWDINNGITLCDKCHDLTRMVKKEKL